MIEKGPDYPNYPFPGLGVHLNTVDGDIILEAYPQASEDKGSLYILDGRLVTTGDGIVQLESDVFKNAVFSYDTVAFSIDAGSLDIMADDMQSLC